MNVNNVKTEIVICHNCGCTMKDKSKFDNAISRALYKLKQETGFGIKEEHETN